MTQIDAARLSRVLASLTKPKERTDTTSKAGEATTEVARGKTSTLRDSAILKSRLSERLKALKKSSTDFAEAAPVVTVQEVLRWEFGEEIFQHPDFERIAGQVASVLMSDDSLKGAVESVIGRLLEGQE